jgi:hypothetical protein
VPGRDVGHGQALIPALQTPVRHGAAERDRTGGAIATPRKRRDLWSR